MNLFYDIWNLISSLSFIDYILYFSVITLIILVVSLIYVVRLEKLEEEKLDQTSSLPSNEVNIEENEEIDLSLIVKNIDENPKPIIDMTRYEEEQEQKAIISYDELIRDVRQTELNYDKEELVDDIIPVKKVSVNPVSSSFSQIELTPREPKILVDALCESQNDSRGKLFSYEKEEAFLKALQQLNELLNS